MDKITDVEVVALSESKFVKPFRVKYTQRGKRKMWDCIRQHNSVAVLIYNKSRDALVMVSQFRPAVYMTANKAALDNSAIFKDNGLRMQSDAEATPSSSSATSSAPQFGPGSDGVTYELCAGIVDKDKPLEQIAQEEVLEETGYDVPVSSLRKITDFWSSIGTGGTHQTVYYCEVTDAMLAHKGGGNPIEGELIDVVYLPVADARQFLVDSSKKKSVGLCFGFMWFFDLKNTPE